VFLRPRIFFRRHANYLPLPSLVIIGWLLGMCRVGNRIHMMALEAINNQASYDTDASWQVILGWMAQSWGIYWGVVCILGAVSGLFIWLLGGWWYHLRLCWCDAEEPDIDLARQVYLHSGLVEAAPAILAGLIAMVLNSSYDQYTASGGFQDFALIIFPFWALVTSYTGVRTCFTTTRWKAWLWFLILPSLFYIAVFAASFLPGPSDTTPPRDQPVEHLPFEFRLTFTHQNDEVEVPVASTMRLISIL
jgi:hypothetical protein